MDYEHIMQTLHSLIESAAARDAHEPEVSWTLRGFMDGLELSPDDSVYSNIGHEYMDEYRMGYSVAKGMVTQ